MFGTVMAAGVAVAVLQLSAGPPQVTLTAAVSSTRSPNVEYANTAAESAARAAYQAGFRYNAGLVFMVAIAGAESSWNPNAFNGSCCYGLWQIYAAKHPSCTNLYNADSNADCARGLYLQSGYNPWNGDGEVSNGVPSTTANLAACGGVCYQIALAAVKAAGLT